MTTDDIGPLSLANGPTTAPLGRETIGACLDRMAAQHQDREALISRHQRRRYTYRQLLEEVERTARGLIAQGVEPGDRVGVWASNCAEWVITQYAAAKAGAILVSLNPAYRLRDLEPVLQGSGVSILIAAPRALDADCVSLLQALAPHVGSTSPVPAHASRVPSLRGIVYLGTERVPGHLSWDDLAASGDAVPWCRLHERANATRFDEPALIAYTSGTTGRAKGATLSHHAILNSGRFVGERLRYTTEDRICIPVPLYHCFGCVLGTLAALTHGSAIVLPDEAFDPKTSLQAIEVERCTSVYGVPTMFVTLLQDVSAGDRDLTSLRTGIMAGAPCPAEMMRQVIHRLHVPELTVCYGTTETQTLFQSCPTDALEQRVSTVGTLHPHLECKIVDPAGRVVPRGTAGELWARGYCVMRGYWNDPDAVAADGSGWMRTGDLAIMRGDGSLIVVGRLKDMIIRGGENIHPRDLEDFLRSCDKVSDVHVVGLPDAKYGEEICAWIKLRDGETSSPDELRRFCRGQIASYMIPRYVRFCDEFPMTASGKVQKFRMREISTGELGLAAPRGV